MQETIFHLGSDVVYTPLDKAHKEYAGKAEVCGINMRGEEEIYLLLLKSGKERISACYEEIALEGAKPRVSRASTRTTKKVVASTESKVAEPETAVNQVVSIKSARTAK